MFGMPAFIKREPAKHSDPTPAAPPLAIADLWEPCSECNGTGEPATPTPAAKPKGPLDPALFFNQVAATSCCQACEGRRGAPTPTGQAVLDLLAKVNAKPYRNSMTHQNLRAS